MRYKIPFLGMLACTQLLSAGLSETEINSLQFMREEEKLAQDIYQVLYEEYGDRQFSNITRSEQRHTNSVLRLMVLYGVEDSSSDKAGTFNNPELQEFYDQLIEQGMQGRTAAFHVGILIEETDIADLEVAIAATENPDLVRVFSNLQRASRNHLKAFTRALAVETGLSEATCQKGRFRSKPTP